ncbi:Glutamate receptor 2.1 [Abeliophyllum distichum]|uniref:Glutamate receptor 2.1 n=1 Tax=Abeliophyllum distichum TaxID=126358 RepID=A0ABD1VCZ2_9LAMI
MLEINAFIPYQSIISPSATDDQIHQELYKLMTMQTIVFVVHMLPSLALRFFLRAKEAEMMSKGCAWIIADVLTSFLVSLDSTVIDARQGVIGVKAHIMKLMNSTTPLEDSESNFSMRIQIWIELNLKCLRAVGI